jgi:hypothetical protein
VLQATAQAPLVQLGFPCAGVGHTVPQRPQLFKSVVVFTHDAPQTVSTQLEPHFAGEDDVSQSASAPEQVLVHEPQWPVVLSAVSHPSLASPLQSPQPGAHDDPGKAQCPLLHVVGPLTCERLVQSLPHEPHVAGRDMSVAHPVPAPAQSAKPAAHP